MPARGKAGRASGRLIPFSPGQRNKCVGMTRTVYIHRIDCPYCEFKGVGTRLDTLQHQAEVHHDLKSHPVDVQEAVRVVEVPSVKMNQVKDQSEKTHQVKQVSLDAL